MEYRNIAKIPSCRAVNLILKKYVRTAEEKTAANVRKIAQGWLF